MALVDRAIVKAPYSWCGQQDLEARTGQRGSKAVHSFSKESMSSESPMVGCLRLAASLLAENRQHVRVRFKIGMPLESVLPPLAAGVCLHHPMTLPSFDWTRQTHGSLRIEWQSQCLL